MVARLPCLGIVTMPMGREEDVLGMPQWQERSCGVVIIQKCSCDDHGAQLTYLENGCSHPGPTCRKPLGCGPEPVLKKQPESAPGFCYSSFKLYGTSRTGEESWVGKVAELRAAAGTIQRVPGGLVP